MKTTRIAFALVSLAALTAACADQTTSPVSPTSQVLSESTAAKPGGTTLLPATITLSDRAGDAVTSDGGGAYVNGGQLEVGFYTASKDLVLKGSGRSLNINYMNRISGTGPVGTLQTSDIFLNVHGVLDMIPGGASRLATMALKRTSKDTFRFNPTKYAGATLVSVVRTASGTWIVTADAPSDRAALVGFKETILGVYALPFQLTAVCPTCL